MVFRGNTRQERFLSAINALNIEFPVAEISRKTGYNESTVSTYVSGNRDVSAKFIKTFCEAYGINENDIINAVNIENNANDIQLTNKSHNQKIEVIPIGKALAGSNSDWDGLPMFNVPISASFITHYRDEGYYQPQYYLKDNRFRDCNFGTVVTGDSMHSEIRHGDYVICKQIMDKRFIVYGDIYYIVATNGLETCKYIQAHKTDDSMLMLVPYNKVIDPSPIPKDMIYELYKVKGIVRGY